MGVLFNEFELDYEQEDLEQEEHEEKSEKEKMEEYNKFKESMKPESAAKDATYSIQELEAMVGSEAEDKQFTIFKNRIDLYPDQVEVKI